MRFPIHPRHVHEHRYRWLSLRWGNDATANHLPFNRNGLKFFTAEGGLNKPDITAYSRSRGTKTTFLPLSQKGKIEERDFISVYSDGLVQKIRESVNHAENYNQPLKGLHIVVDAGNGAGGFYASKVLEPLGADTTGSQFLDPDGNFPNHIPNPENDNNNGGYSKRRTGEQS